MHTILSHPLLDFDLTVIRNRDTESPVFRSALERIAMHLCLESTRHLKCREFEIMTPLQPTAGYTLRGDVILVPVLRAGLTLLHAFSQQIPEAKIGYIGLKRNEETLEPTEYYCNIPAITAETTVIILDPMLATGGSLCAAIADVKKRGAQHVIAACVVAAPQGIALLEQEHPDVMCVCAVLDQALNDDGYIVPGLGDAGDRAHGTL